MYIEERHQDILHWLKQNRCIRTLDIQKEYSEKRR